MVNPNSIGQVLLRKGLVDQEDLNKVLSIQKKSGSKLGSLFIAHNIVKRLDIYKTLSEMWGYPFIDCTSIDLDENIVSIIPPDEITRKQWVPLFRNSDNEIIVAVATQPTSEIIQEIQETLQQSFKIFVTTDWDLSQVLSKACKEPIIEEASLGLWNQSEDMSARVVLSKQQKVIFFGLLLFSILFFTVAFKPSLVFVAMVVNLYFLFSIAFKFYVCMKGAKFEKVEKISEREVEALDDRTLPIYTILVPVYKEANVLPDLMKNLMNLDYPSSKLDILILLEEDDKETWDAAIKMNPPGNVRLIKIPAGAPQTKPKACNVGLFFAKGEYLVIYDAEDRPDPDQLKKAVIAFRNGDESLVCVQAALNYFNAYENSLTRMFTAEYSFWFDYMLPGLDSLKLPIPLGGTSNHFKTDMLRKLGGWDPFNVTEDADLGIRASAMGYKVSVINSTTFEEANNHYGNFVRQRSRWIKGYMQTTLVHLRHPLKLLKTVGLKSSLGFALLIAGTPVTFLAVLPLYAMFVASLFWGNMFGELYPDWLEAVGIVNLLVGTSLMIYVSMLGAFKRNRFKLVKWGVLNPVYWLLHTTAAYKALWQLIVRPHYWEKTLHGLTTQTFENDESSSKYDEVSKETLIDEAQYDQDLFGSEVPYELEDCWNDLEEIPDDLFDDLIPAQRSSPDYESIDGVYNNLRIQESSKDLNNNSLLEKEDIA